MKLLRIPFDHHVVVARYKEDIRWLYPLGSVLRIYNKSDDVPDIDHVQLPNVGRESHTYLTYIIENYDNLPGVIMFTQGNVQDHIGENSPVLLQKMILQAKKHGLSKNFAPKQKVSYDFTLSEWKGKLRRSKTK